MKKSLLLLSAVAALQLPGAVNWQGKIPAGVKDNVASVIKAARLDDFQILAGTMDSPAIAAEFKKHFAGKELKMDGFFLVIDGKKIVAGSPLVRGTIYAISHAAEKLNDYIAPRPLGQDEILPGKAKSGLKYKICTNPAFRTRGFSAVLFNNVHATFARWMLRNRFNSAYGSIRFTNDYYDAVTNLGLPWNTSGHSFYYWLPGKYHKTNPEFFPIIDGKPKLYRGNYATQVQLNVANKGLQDLVVNRMLDYIKNHPECETVAFGMNDGTGWGNSPGERAFDDPGEYKRHIYSTRYFRFANLIAERVCKVYPKIKIVTFAYLRCLEPPKLEKLHPNLIIKLCTYRRCYKCRINDPECTINQKWNKLLIDWSKFGNEICIYDYLKLGGSPEFPVPMMKVIQQDLQYYRTLGITGYETELIVDGGPVILAAPKFKGKGFYRSKPADHERYWTGAKLIFYLLGKVLWDPDVDIDRLTGEYFNKFYGAAGKDMRRIYAIIEKRWNDDPAPYVWSGSYTNFPIMLLKRQDVPVIEKHLKSAAAAVAGQPLYAARVEKMAKLIRGLWFIQMDAKSKTLSVVNGKAVIDGGFVARSKRGAVPSVNRSKVALEFKDGMLHIKGEFFQPEATIVVKNPGRDASGDYGDTFEIFIDAGPKNLKHGSYQFIVSAGGSLWDGQLRNANWNSSTIVKTAIKSDRWVADVTIPLKELGYNSIKKGDQIRANFVIIRHKPKTEISGWSSTALEGRSSLGVLEIK